MTRLASRVPALVLPLILACGGGDSSGPGGSGPLITRLQPDTLMVGTSFPGSVMLVHGVRFGEDVRVYFDGELRTTTYVDTKLVRMTWEAGDTDVPGTHQVAVQVGIPLEPGTPTFPLVVLPAPAIDSLTPASAPAESPPMEVVIRGHNFWPASTVALDLGTPLNTTWVDTTEMRVTVPADFLELSRFGRIRVVSDGVGSPNATFTVFPVTPTLTALDPVAATAGGTEFTLTVTGSDFMDWAKVHWGDLPLVTTRDSREQLRAEVPASYLTWPGVVEITVHNPKPPSVLIPGGVSNPLQFTVQSPPEARTGD